MKTEKGMFDKSFEIEINGVNDIIIIKPLPIVEVPTLIKVLSKLPAKDEVSNQEILLSLADDDTMSEVLRLVKATIVKSYPEMDMESVDDFVAVNWIKILPLMSKVNIRS